MGEPRNIEVIYTKSHVKDAPDQSLVLVGATSWTVNNYGNLEIYANADLLAEFRDWRFVRYVKEGEKGN